MFFSPIKIRHCRAPKMCVCVCEDILMCFVRCFFFLQNVSSSISMNKRYERNGVISNSGMDNHVFLLSLFSLLPLRRKTSIR